MRVIGCRKAPQFLIDQRKKLLGSLGIAFFDGGED